MLVTDGEQPEPLSLGGYRITLTPLGRRRTAAPTGGTPGQAGSADTTSRRTSGHASTIERYQAVCDVVNTAPDEFLFIGADAVPRFSCRSSGPVNLAVASKEEGRLDNGKWVRVRRLNGDEAGSGLPEVRVGLLKIRLVRFD